jgi:hypothetical protein
MYDMDKVDYKGTRCGAMNAWLCRLNRMQYGLLWYCRREGQANIHLFEERAVVRKQEGIPHCMIWCAPLLVLGWAGLGWYLCE